MTKRTTAIVKLVLIGLSVGGGGGALIHIGLASVGGTLAVIRPVALVWGLIVGVVAALYYTDDIL